MDSGPWGAPKSRAIMTVGPSTSVMTRAVMATRTIRIKSKGDRSRRQRQRRPGPAKTTGDEDAIARDGPCPAQRRERFADDGGRDGELGGVSQIAADDQRVGDRGSVGDAVGELHEAVSPSDGQAKGDQN